ncbi:MAG: hypothetical protein KDD01_17755 [Phaeodactylibacter sp.]|nr:hypothetical protein [Phaeodactylibacter sp.]
MGNKISLGARVPEPLYEDIRAEADSRGLNVSQIIIERLKNKSGMNKEELRATMADLLEEMLESREVEEYDPNEEYYETGEQPLDLAELFPPLVAEELNCLVSKAHQTSIGAERDEPNTPYLVLLYENLAMELDESIEGKPQQECSSDYRDELAEEDALILSEIFADVRNELGPDPERIDIFDLLKDLLEGQAEDLFIEARKVAFRFDREQWRVLDQLVEHINSDHTVEEQFSDFDSLLLFILGTKLKEKAGEKFFGGFQRPAFSELGGALQLAAFEG